LIAVKLIGTVVVQFGNGDDVVRVTEPLPVAEDVVPFVTFTLTSARTGPLVPVLVTLNEAGLMVRPGDV
jgi:hypothetical protein